MPDSVSPRPPSYLVIEGQPFDEQGNPLVTISGCPNCGKGAGEPMDPITYFGKCNVGRDPNAPCSRRCRLQLEYAATLVNPPEVIPFPDRSDA